MSYILVSGRTAEQAKGMHVGKCTDFYRQAVSVLEMNAQDIAAENLSEADEAIISSPYGEAAIKIKPADIPRGMVFIPMGPVANAITGDETDGTGMPLFKGFLVDIKKAAA